MSASEPSGERSAYRPDVDGLRAVAVLAVVMFHAQLGFPGGFVGVDVFFVISGFLITRLLNESVSSGRFTFVGFWERRARRLFPAAAAVLLAVGLAGYLLLLPRDLRDLGRSMGAQSLVSQNVYFWFTGGYFGVGDQWRPLLHTWSLAVEEQFYLLFPLLVVGIWKLRWRPWWVLTFVAVVSLGYSILLPDRLQLLNFFMLPGRAWELALGALVTCLPPPQPRTTRPAQILSVLGMAAVLAGFFAFDSDTRIPGVMALVPCLGTATLIWANGHEGILIRHALSWRPLVGIGLVSYSLYLWHWPVFTFARYWCLPEFTLFVRVGCVLASFGLAWASWQYVETPFRKRQWLATPARMLTATAVTAVLVLVAGISLHLLRGVPGRFSSAVLNAEAGAYDLGRVDSVEVDEMKAGKLPHFGATTNATPPSVLLWGDSHAMMLINLLDGIGKDTGVSGLVVTRSATIPVLGSGRAAQGGAWGDAALEYIERSGVQTVILAAVWEAYGKEPEVAERLRSTAARLLAANKKVVLVRSVPRPGFDVPRTLAMQWIRHDRFGGPEPEAWARPIAGYQPSQDAMNEQITAALRGSGVTFIEPAKVLQTEGKVRIERDQRPLYRDVHHLTSAGAMELRGLFDGLFRPVAN